MKRLTYEMGGFSTVGFVSFLLKLLCRNKNSH